MGLSEGITRNLLRSSTAYIRSKFLKLTTMIDQLSLINYVRRPLYTRTAVLVQSHAQHVQVPKVVLASALAFKST